jgi:vacuolar-type H+-ATPase subunit H
MTAIRDDDVGAEPDAHRPIEGALVELIALEAQIEAQIEQAKEEAKRIVAQARQRARASEEDGADALDVEARALRASSEAESADAVRVLGERAQLEAERYRRVDEATLSRLSQWVVSRILRGSEPT